MATREIFLSLCAITVFSACASSSTKVNLDAKLAQEPPSLTRLELEAQIDQFLASAPRLDPIKKSQINALREETRSRLSQIRADIHRHESVLFKDLLAPDYDEAEVKVLKNHLKELEKEQLSVFFSAVEQANLIVGHWPSKEARLDVEFAPPPQQFPPR